MNHTKLILTKDGNRVNILVTFWLNNNKPIYNISISVCKKGKRKFIYPNHSHDYEYRRLCNFERNEYLLKKYLEVITIEDINEAKLELYNLLKPQLTP